MKWICPNCGNDLSENDVFKSYCCSCKKIFEIPLKVEEIVVTPTLFSPIKEAWSSKPTEQLVEILKTNDRNEYTDECFAVIREILIKRGVMPSPQEKSRKEKDAGKKESNGDYAEPKKENVVSSGVKQEPAVFYSIIYCLFIICCLCVIIFRFGRGILELNIGNFNIGNFLLGVILFVSTLSMVSYTIRLCGRKIYEGRCPYCGAELNRVRSPADTCACCKKPFLVRSDGFHKME